MADREAPEDDIFEIGQETKSEEAFAYDEEAPNLAREFKKHREGKQALKRIANKCLTDFENAWGATETYRKRMATIWNLFAGTLEDKDPRFKDLSNPHVPILLENTIRMVSRQAYELFGNWSQVFGVTPIGPDDEHVAKLLTLHGNWQIRKRIKDFKRQQHRGLLMFDLFGDVTCYSYWDATRRSNRHEMLTANEFVSANAHVSTMPDYSDVSWLARVLYKDPHELRKMDKAWEDVGSVLKNLPPEYDDATLSQELSDEVNKSIGVDPTAYQAGQFKLIHYEGWLNLPPTMQKNEAGEENEPRDRYCKVIVDWTTHTVLSLAIHERTDPYDKQRFAFQMKQLQQYQAAQQELQAFLAEQEQAKTAALELAHTAEPDSDVPAQAVAMSRALQDMPPPPEVPMPDWMNGDPLAQPEPAATVPVRLFAHGVNIEPIMGTIGMGTGSIHADQNKAANIAASAYVDQTFLANFTQFLAKGDVRFREKFSVTPGKIHQVDNAVDLSKDILPLKFDPANPGLLTLIEMMQKWANSVSNTPEVLAGEAGKSGETAQGLANRIEQATKMLSVPTGKYADFLSQVLENNAALNAVFMEESEFFSVNNHDPVLGQMGRQTFNVGRDMYDRPYDVEISADLKFTSTSQRISEADALVQLPNSVMAMGQNYAFVYETIKKSLEARSRYDLVALLGAPPQPPAVFGVPTSPPAPPPGAVPPGPPGQGAANSPQQPPGGPPQPQQGPPQ